MGGLTEATSPDNELLGRDRLENLLKEKTGRSAEVFCTMIRQAVHDFQHGVRFDDVTVMGLKRT